MSDLALIADDLTGAADSAVPFAASGFTTAIAFDKPRRERADVIALSTNSRDVALPEAERRIRLALTAVFGEDGEYRPAWIYKKMDSALRGHPIEELLITMQLARATRVVVAPAIPSQGRTTVGGVVLDRGIPLSQTAIGREHGRENLVRLFQRKARVPVRVIDLRTIRGDRRNLRNALTIPGSWIAVADAETDADLVALAEVGIASGIRFFSGAAGLANVLGGRLPIEQLYRPPAIARRKAPVLVVAGSRHATTAAQLDHAEAAGARRITLRQEMLDNDAADPSDIRSAVLESLASGANTIVTTVGLEFSSRGGGAVSDCLATVATDPEIISRIGGMVLTGGDVAHAVCRRLGVHTIWLRGEVLPAIPWATVTAERADGLPIVTKAGSFGEGHAISHAVEHLVRQQGSGP
jgi:uncharacterized protein YgbK (DUF1537 family)